MLPNKITTHLNEIKGIQNWNRKKIRSYLLELDDEYSINNVYDYAHAKTITKIIYKMLDDTKVNFTDITSQRQLINLIRSDPSKNYHEYLTEFQFETEHPIYDLIVVVNYRYVYS